MKKLLLTSAIAAFLLSGCGGSDDNKESKINLEGKWSEISEWGEITSDFLEVNDNKIYIYDWDNWDFNIFSPMQEYSNHIWYDLSEAPATLISSNGLFDIDYDPDNDTYFLGKITSSSNTKWTISPQHDEGKNDLKFNFNVEKINLSGKSYLAAFPTLAIDIDEDPNYYNQNSINLVQTSKFPEGSYCLAPKSLKSSTKFILGVVEADDSENPNLLSRLFNEYNNFTSSFTDTLIYNSNFKGSYGYLLSYGYFAGTVDNMNFYGGGAYAESSNELITTDYYYDQDDTSLTASQKALLTNRCVYFNEKATDFIDSVNDQW